MGKMTPNGGHMSDNYKEMDPENYNSQLGTLINNLRGHYWIKDVDVVVEGEIGYPDGHYTGVMIVYRSPIEEKVKLNNYIDLRDSAFARSTGDTSKI